MKILVIEDGKFFQNFYSLKLKAKGFEVEIAADGDEGLLKAKSNQPNLILLDIIMPKKDGFEFLKEFNVDPLNQKIPVIVFSTLGQEADIQKAKSLGARDYVNKSFFDFENLYSKIVSYLK